MYLRINFITWDGLYLYFKSKVHTFITKNIVLFFYFFCYSCAYFWHWQVKEKCKYLKLNQKSYYFQEVFFQKYVILFLKRKIQNLKWLFHREKFSFSIISTYKKI